MLTYTCCTGVPGRRGSSFSRAIARRGRHRAARLRSLVPSAMGGRGRECTECSAQMERLFYLAVFFTCHSIINHSFVHQGHPPAHQPWPPAFPTYCATPMASLVAHQLLLLSLPGAASFFHSGPHYAPAIERSIQQWELPTLREQVRQHHVRKVAFRESQHSVVVLDMNGAFEPDARCATRCR